MSKDLVCQCVRRITPYSPGKFSQEVMEEFGLTEVIKLASNENPLGPSPKAVEAICAAAGDVHVYPDPVCRELSAKLAAHMGVSADSIMVGRGSDELIHMLGLAFLNPGDEMIYSEFPFALYPMTAHVCDAVCKQVPAKGFDHDLDAMLDAVTDRTKIIIIGNPCNPTGTIVTQQQVDDFMARVPEDVIVLFDEAYYEYADDPAFPNCLDYVRAGRNAVVMRTFSKIYGLAGLRVGYCSAGPRVIEGLRFVLAPFNVSTVGQAAALAALDDAAHVRATQEQARESKQYWYGEFEAMGLSYVPTQANFLLVNVKQDCRAVYDGLMRRGITVRTGDIWGLNTMIRVSYGTMDQNRKFIAALREVLA
ncbi:histidinol-phosphate transaminase [bacterium]|nr:histidinol-phosphate transaminase [bacterium]